MLTWKLIYKDSPSAFKAFCDWLQEKHESEIVYWHDIVEVLELFEKNDNFYLFDMLEYWDTKGYRVNTFSNLVKKGALQWFWYIDSDEEENGPMEANDRDITYETRKEATISGLAQCFKLHEEQLEKEREKRIKG